MSITLDRIWPIKPKETKMTELDPFTIFTASGFLLFLLFKFSRDKRAKCTVPFGEQDHWLFGNYFLSLGDWWKKTAEMAPRCGPVFRFQIIPFVPSSSIVVVTDLEVIKDIMNNKDFANRPNDSDPGLILMNPEKKGIIFGDYSEKWQRLHRTTKSILSSFGFGKMSMENKVLQEADCLFASMSSSTKPIAPRNLLRVAIGNVTMRILINDRVDVDATAPLTPSAPTYEVLQSLYTLGGGFFYLMTEPIYNVWPRSILWYKTELARKVEEANFLFKKFIKDQIKSHEENFDENDVKDFVDGFIRTRRKNPQEEALDYQELIETVRDFFIGGVDTNSGVIDWTFVWLIYHPEVLAKLRTEIDGVFGKDGIPTLSQLPQLPYLHAFMDEVLRLFTVAIAPHRCTVDEADFYGYKVTKNDNIWFNIRAVHRSPKFFDEPEKFKPERFIDSEGKYLKNENLLFFGVGPRRCTGENLAKLVQFLFTVRLVQRLDFRCTTPLPDTTTKFYLTPEPGYYEISVKERN